MGWPYLPYISALMVVEHLQMLEIAREAQRCFFEQDWPLKQLVVFNSTGKRLNWLPQRHVKEIKLRRTSRVTALSILRENADGEFCALWDADCWYASSVLRHHVMNLAPDASVVFRDKTCFSLASNKAYIISDDRILHGSFMRTCQIDFTKPFYKQTPRVKILDVPSGLVVKFVNKIINE